MKKRPRSVPGWDDYFMALCFIVAARSKDPSTQHGAIITDHKHRIQGTGYNGAPSSIADTEIDWNRPAKYPFIIHAEQNAIDHCTGHPDTLTDSTIYVTGPPCSECAKRIISKKIKKIVFGPQKSNMVNEEDWAITRELCKLARVSLERYAGNLNWLRDRLSWMENHMQEVFQPTLPLPL
jgi:dCMP deaminase